MRAVRLLYPFLYLTLVASAGCSSASQRTWSKLNVSTADDHEARVDRGAFDQARAAAQSQESYAVSQYAGVFMKFMWEVAPLFEAREAPEGKESTVIAGLDRGELIEEYSSMVKAVEAEVGYYPWLHTVAGVATNDCEAVVRDLTLEESCAQVNNADASLTLARAACGEVRSICRSLSDVLPDPRHRYIVMMKCAEHVGGEERPALETWASADEIEFYFAMKTQLQQQANERQFWLSMAAAGAARVNEERRRRYSEAMADWEANQSGIESKSSIGSLDPGDQPPPPPAMISSVSIPLPAYEKVGISELATAVMRNQCDKAMVVGQPGARPRDIIDPVVVEPGQTASIVVTRCNAARWRYRDEDSGHGEARIVEPVAGVELQSDCSTSKAITPAELETLGFDSPEPGLAPTPPGPVRE